MNKPPETIELTDEKVEGFLKKVKENLSADDFEIAKALVAILAFLNSLVGKKTATIARMVRMIFGVKTESSNNVLPKTDNKEDSDKLKKKKKKKRKGHGRNSHKDFTGADRIKVPHESIKPGDPCGECPKGKFYEIPPEIIIRFKGAPPVNATVYELQKFRCNLCGRIDTAKPPEGIGEEKYDETVASTVANMKYGAGMPFTRLEKLQKNAGVPLPASNQYEIAEEASEKVKPAWEELIRRAARKPSRPTATPGATSSMWSRLFPRNAALSSKLIKRLTRTMPRLKS